jgi:hypothetical protein
LWAILHAVVAATASMDIRHRGEAEPGAGPES